MNLHYNLVVIGGGSGGFGSALAAARLGIRVLLVEQSDMLGGTATRGGVNNWEPGVGGTGIAFDLYRRLRRHENAIGIYRYHRHFKWQSGPTNQPVVPGSELLIDPARQYLDSLRRHGAGPFAESEAFIRSHWSGVPFEPAIYAAEMEAMLLETGCCTIWKTTSFLRCAVAGTRIDTLFFDNDAAVTADFVIDATANILVAKDAGCQTLLGQDARSRFDEPSAPVTPNDRLNGATLIYRVSRMGKAAPGTDPLPADIPADCWWADAFPPAVFTQYPNGDFNVNALPTMSGREAMDLGYAAARAECMRRIRAHWHHVQTIFPEYQAFHMVWIAPGLGVREGPRIIARKMLTEHDLLAGISAQTDPDIVTIADHARDTHGADTGRAGCGELDQPYGVPFRSLLPLDVDNLAVACRGAGFSSVAASSCRLSRTMMQLGQAAGTAAAIALEQNVDSFAEVDASDLRRALAAQHVELSWPRTPAMLDYLANEAAA
ncbi:FAD-dependent oxidoreductase [Sphingobium algorifonticola]|uniref:FAD-dependent oxidoreductase n=1 Tax=Sphingobium algorifonticola TaxID=2008318 RepID=A0A437JCI9_9SPHN|nr:FAD-dependent oxidoreductase [Sphingobium algorifonticola]RVT43460.1 FAD-dependent oxidoreductase [Sphingobium algorifonticola]